MVRSILGFLGFGRSGRLARMVRKARARTLRAYGPTFGFYGAEYRNAPRGSDDAGNIRRILYMGRGADFAARWAKVPPYRKGWGIPFRVAFRTTWPNPQV